MKLQEAINKYFSKDQLIDSICKYQLYYQIGLGNVVLQSIQDIEEAYKKLDELNLQIDSQKVFEAIYEIVLHLSRQEDFEEKFESHLKFTALVQMLNDFIEADKDLISSKPFADMIYEKIKDNTFFDTNMKEQFETDFGVILLTWQAVITDEIADDVKDVVSEIFKKE